MELVCSNADLRSSRRSTAAVGKSSVAPNSSKPMVRSTATPLENSTMQGSTLTPSFTVKKGESCARSIIVYFRMECCRAHTYPAAWLQVLVLRR